ncbi:unnamed protein product [Closterium sp. NIES-65]|nr:unnamed protein product [Closterium sp. NIES-65]
MAPTTGNGVISPLFTLEEDSEATVVTQSEPTREFSAPITTCFFDLDDTLYPSSAGLGPACVKNIEDYMVQRLGFAADTAGEEAIRLYKEHGTSMAGLRAEGYAFDFDDWHAFVHGRLPYHLLKPDPALRHLLDSLPQRKFVFTNADRMHASHCLRLLGLEGCFDAVISFEEVMAQQPSQNFNLRNNFRPSCTSDTTHGPDFPNGSDGSDGSDYLLDSDHGLLPSSLPPIPSASSTASLPSANLSSDCSNGSSGSSSPERLLPISIQDQQEGPSEQQQQQQQQRGLEQQESKQVNLPQVLPFRCNSRRCVSADALVEHASAHPLSALTHRDAARLAAASPAAAAAAAPPQPTPAAAAAAASAVAQSWMSPAGPLICCKPQAEAFHRAVVGIARADPHSSIFFDDSTRNISAAKRFGMHTVLVGTSQSSAGADYVIANIHEMKKQIPALWKASESNETGIVTEGVKESPCICHQSRNLGLVLA